MNRMMLFGVLGLLALVVLMSAVFTVREDQRAILFRLGQIERADYAPGIHFKAPFVNDVRFFDARVLTSRIKNERFLTIEKKNVIVDAFVKWRIDDLSQYYTSTGGDEFQAGSKLIELIKDGLRAEFAKRTVKQVVSGERREVMATITGTKRDEARKNLGVEIVDVRLTAVDLSDALSEKVYARIRTERFSIAAETRSRGEAAATEIRATADKKRTVALAEARRQSQELRGGGDAEATRLYAEAYGSNSEFYGFYRSLDAYKNSFGGSGDVLVLKPDSEFFRYFKGELKSP